jgi:hypothetical protein
LQSKAEVAVREFGGINDAHQDNTRRDEQGLEIPEVPATIPVFGHNAELPFGAAARYKGST